MVLNQPKWYQKWYYKVCRVTLSPRQELYTYRVEWSEDDQEFVGTVAEFPSLSYLAPTSTEAFAGIREVVADTLEILEEDGREATRTVLSAFLLRTIQLACFTAIASSSGSAGSAFSPEPEPVREPTLEAVA